MVSLARATETALRIFEKHPPVPPGFTHKVAASNGFHIPAISAAQSAIGDTTERKFLHMMILLVILFSVANCPDSNLITEDEAL
jgi:hypothetical protein